MQDLLERAALAAAARSRLERALKAAQVERELKAAEDFHKIPFFLWKSPFFSAHLNDQTKPLKIIVNIKLASLQILFFAI
jgi:hypothetical protein